jgi:hypothetical protein
MTATATQTVPGPAPDTTVASATQPAPRARPDTSVFEKLKRGEVPTPEEMKALVSRRLASRTVYGRPRAALAAFRALAVLCEGDVDPAAAGQMIRLCVAGRPGCAAAAVRALAAAARARKKASRRWCR